MKLCLKICVLISLFAAAGTCHAGSIAWRTNSKGQKVYYNTITFSDESKKYEALVTLISKKHSVPARLVKAVIQVESGYDHQAISPVGAMGLMQLMPDTAARFGVKKAFIPAENIEGGVRYLSYLLKLFKSNTQLAVAAYNAGENRVKRMNAIPNFVETQNYVRKVLALYKGEMKYIPYTGV
jgi:soluble lytic murein transglycosylase-like protein